MKKTSKKVVSLLTILSFLLTLVPAAAFADGEPAATTVTKITAPAAGAKLEAGKTTVEGELSQKPDATEKVFVGVVKDKKIAKPVEAKVTDTAFKGDVDVAKDDKAIGAVVAKDAEAAKTVEVAAPVAVTVKDAAPAPATAGPSKDRSYIEVEDDTRDVGDITQVRVGVKTAAGLPVGPEGNKIVVWAGTSTTSNDSVEFKNKVKSFKDSNGADMQGIYEIVAPEVGVTEMDVQFNKEGDYQFYAAIVPANAKIENISDLAQYRVNEYGDAKVKVRPDEDVKCIKVLDEKGNELATLTEKDNKSHKKITVDANGLTETKIKVVAYKDEEGTILADKGTVVDFDTNSANLMLNKDSDKIDYTGEAEVKLTGDVYGTYKLYITVGDIDATLENVVVEKSEASYIELTKAPKNALAWNSDFKTKGMEDFVHIQIKDINNNVMKGNLWDKVKKEGEPVCNSGDPEEYVKVLSQPDSMDLDDDQFYVKPVTNNAGEDKDYYTLVSEKELKAGKYSVQLGLKNGKKAVVNFEIAKFGTAKELKIDYDTESVELDSFVEAPTIVLVDENGVEKKSEKRVTLGYNGYAVETVDYISGDKHVKPFDTDDGSFWVKDDEKYLGSKITVTAVAEREGLSAKAELTVAQDGRNIKFLDNKGAVGANNKVIFQLVDGDGKTVALGGGGYDTSAVTIQSVSDDTAKVSATVNNTGDLSDKGTGELSLTSDKPVTADIQVYVRNKDGKYYAGNLKYTFGKTASNADTTVVMTIGSKDVIVDNNIVATDTAALIKNDRTFVPYRALAEAFGAKVEWNEKDRTITTQMDGKTVVMTIDKKEYKVNDKEMTMDVAPYISGDRTLVPVRFVAEALGFKVTPTYNTDGTTASVVFNK